VGPIAPGFGLTDLSVSPLLVLLLVGSVGGVVRIVLGGNVRRAAARAGFTGLIYPR
jgi:hypothetical protein